MKKNSTIEHQQDEQLAKSYVKKGNENKNVNNINIKNTINLGDLIKQIRTKPKPKKKSKRKGITQEEEQQIIQQGMDGAPGLPGLPGMAGMSFQQPNQPQEPNQPMMQPNQPMMQPNQLPGPPNELPPLEKELEDAFKAYEEMRKIAEDDKIEIPENLKNIESSMIADPSNPIEIRNVINELRNDTQNIANLLPQPSRDSSTLDQLAFSNRPRIQPPPPLISSSAIGQQILENISSNSVRGIQPVVRSSGLSLRDMGILERIGSRQNNTIEDLNQLKNLYQRYTISLYKPPFPNQSTQEQVNDLYSKLSTLNENQLKRITPSVLQQERDIKFESIDDDKPLLPRVLPIQLPIKLPIQLPIQFRDNNSTQTGLDLARISQSSGLSNFLSEVSAIQKSPLKVQEQIYRDLIKEPLNPKYLPETQTARIQPKIREPRQKKKGSTTPEIRPIVEGVKQLQAQQPQSFKNELNQLDARYKTSLLDTIASQQPKPIERNLLGKTFSAFSDLLSGSRDARDAAAYGGVALGTVQPELIPAIGLAETGNQALNIIEAPVNAIERAIQARINRPQPIKTYRTDAYGNRFALNP
jgi:hypothetical protein